MRPTPPGRPERPERPGTEPGGTAEPDLNAGAGEVGRPLLMDPAGARRPGFAPPAALVEPIADLSDTGAGRAGGQTITPTATAPVSSPWAPGTARGQTANRVRPGYPDTPSVLAGTAPGPGAAVGDAGRTAAPAEASRDRAEATFGPISMIVTVSVRTPSSRVDLAMPDRTTIAEILETVLDVAPRSLREQALAHGGWILRTAAGRPLPGSTRLLDEGIGNGTTLFLAGANTAEPAVVYDDTADAVADAVRATASTWPGGTGRVFALGATAAFAALSVLAALILGPPWTPALAVLTVLTLGSLVAATVVARRVRDDGLALLLGIVPVVTGAVAATVATAGSAPLTALGPVPWLLGAAASAVLAGTASLLIGSRRVPFIGIITGAGIVGAALACGAVFDLSRLGTAAVLCGLAVCAMPILPSLSLRFAAFESEPLPSSPQELATIATTRRTLDAAAVGRRTDRAVGLLTGFVQGSAWPALAAAAVLAFGGQPAGQALAAVVGLGLVLRARLFPVLRQRLPLLLCGLGCLLAVPAGMLATATSQVQVVVVAGAAAVAAAAAAVLAGRRTRRTPFLRRAAEITDLVLAILVVPLVAAALGAFEFVRGLGG